jgi:DNA-binding protein H-NS
MIALITTITFMAIAVVLVAVIATHKLNREKSLSTALYILSWEWVKSFLYWLVVSAGTISECVFLMASLWISVNATVHPLMLKVVSEAVSETLSQLSVASFTSLPEIIVGLAFVTTYGHIKSYCLHKKKSSLTWGILFGLPTIVFMGLSLWTLGSSSLHIGYEMPPFIIATRALSGYLYGFLSMLFVLIGKPDYADFVSSKENKIADLEASIATQKAKMQADIEEQKNRLETIIENLTNDLETVNVRLIESTNQTRRLAQRAENLERTGIEDYPNVISEWIEKGVKTVSIDEIATITGHSKRRLCKAPFQRHNRNKDLIIVSSVIDWLKIAPLPDTKVVSIDDYIEMEA